MNIWSSKQSEPDLVERQALNHEIAAYIVRSVQGFDLAALARSLR